MSSSTAPRPPLDRQSMDESSDAAAVGLNRATDKSSDASLTNTNATNQIHNQDKYSNASHRSTTSHHSRMGSYHRRRSSSSSTSLFPSVVKRPPGRPPKKRKASPASTAFKQDARATDEYADDSGDDSDNSASPLPPLVPLHLVSPIKPKPSANTSDSDNESKSPVRSTSPSMPQQTTRPAGTQSMRGRPPTTGRRTGARPSGPIASPTAAVPTSELAALIANINHAWKHLEYNMMHRPLLADMKNASASISSSHSHSPTLENRKPTQPPHANSSNDSSAAAPIEPMDADPPIMKAPLNGSLSSSIVANLSKSTLDSEERKELLEHVKLLAEKRKREGKALANLKCSRVGPRYQAKITSVLPPPLTPELLKSIRDEPYDYERFSRDELPVQMGDFDLQVQLMKSSSVGAPAFPLEERFRVRISSFINRRRERKRKEDERRAQQSVSQQIQEARSGFSFHALDATAGRKSSSVNHAAANNGRPSSPPVDPLASYGSVVFKDVTDNGEGGESLESKRRSSRITPSLVVKQYSKPVATKPSAASSSNATAGSDSIKSGLPAELDYQFSQVADKRTAREQADADRRLAEKLQAYYEREHTTGKVGRKVRRDLGAKRGPKAKSINPAPADNAAAPAAASATANDTTATTAPPVVNTPSSSPPALLSVASLFPTNAHFPTSSLSSLSAPNSTSPMGSRVASAHSSPHMSGQKRKRSPSPLLSGKVSSSTSSGPSLHSTPPLNPIKRIVAPSEEQQRQVNAALHHQQHHTLSSLDSIHILPPSAASKQHHHAEEHKSSLPPAAPVAPVSSARKPGRPPKSAASNLSPSAASTAAATASANAAANEILLQAMSKQKAHVNSEYVSHTPSAAIHLPIHATASPANDTSVSATHKSTPIPILPLLSSSLDGSAPASSAPLRDIPQHAYNKPAKTVGAKLAAAARAAKDDSKKRVASIAAVSGIADSVSASKRGKGLY